MVDTAIKKYSIFLILSIHKFKLSKKPKYMLQSYVVHKFINFLRNWNIWCIPQNIENK